jgi:hypothetical protein
VARLLPQVLMDAEVLALAVMTDLLSGDQRRRYTDMIDSPYMPALRAPVPLSHVDRPKKLPTAPQVRQGLWLACLCILSVNGLCLWSDVIGTRSRTNQSYWAVVGVVHQLEGAAACVIQMQA